MKDKGIRNLLVDFGSVLITLDRQRCINNFKKLGLNNVDELLGAYTEQDIFMKLEKGLITSAQFRDGIREAIGRADVTDEQIDAAWNSYLLDIPSYKLDLLLKLRQKYVVYLLSNTNEIHWRWSCEHAFPYRGFRSKDYFEKIYLSYEMQMMKPDAEIFEAVLADAGIDPRQTLFIDDIDANCQTARTLGISTYTPQAGEDWGHLFQ